MPIKFPTVVSLLILTLTPALNPSAYAKDIIRFATLAPEGSTWMAAMRELEQRVRDETGGELEFKFYPNMSMGDEKDVIRKLRLGQVNAAGFTGRGLGEILPEIRVLELPYLFRDDAEFDSVLFRLDPYFDVQFSKRGFILLGWVDVGWIYFISRKPVAAPAQLSGTKAWMWQGDPLAEAFFAELNKTPVPLSITDVLLSLQTGMIDAVYCSPLAALALQWFTRLTFISDVPFTNAIGALLVDKMFFDRLDERVQEILLRNSRTITRNLTIASRADNRSAYQTLLREGIQAVASTSEQRAEMEAVGKRVQDRLAGELFSDSLLTEIRMMLTELRRDRKGIKGIPGDERN